MGRSRSSPPGSPTRWLPPARPRPRCSSAGTRWCRSCPSEPSASGPTTRSGCPTMSSGTPGGIPRRRTRAWRRPRRPSSAARGVPAGGRLVVLLSGGASSLLCRPVDGVTLAEKQQITRALMHDGRAIDELNCVRKHLSLIKGGRLAAACAGQTLTLAISDVVAPVEDDPSVIGSGPTVPDPSTFAEAWRIVSAIAAQDAVPASVREYLSRGVAGAVPESAKPGDAAMTRSRYELIGTRHAAMAGAAEDARRLGYDVVVLAAAGARRGARGWCQAPRDRAGGRRQSARSALHHQQRRDHGDGDGEGPRRPQPGVRRRGHRRAVARGQADAADQHRHRWHRWADRLRRRLGRQHHRGARAIAAAVGGRPRCATTTRTTCIAASAPWCGPARPTPTSGICRSRSSTDGNWGRQAEIQNAQCSAARRCGRAALEFGIR